MFSEAALLMIVGMAFVFLFLGLLIFCVSFIIAPLGKKYPDTINTNERATDQGPTPQVIAAISAAIKKHRQSSYKK